jgi:HAT1-interacting factor 1
MADIAEARVVEETPSTVPTLPTPATSDERDSLSTLVAQATAKYAIKDYVPAAEFYSQATELQAKLNGEMALENADLLYNYGKCLYFVAVKNSDVLGGEAAGAKLGSTKPSKRTKKTRPDGGSGNDAKSVPPAASGGLQRQAEEVVTALVDERSGGGPVTETSKDGEPAEEKPYFQFAGDENWDDSDENAEADDAQHTGEEEAEEDDFANAFELLDLSRVLFLSKLKQIQSRRPGDNGTGDANFSQRVFLDAQSVKEKLADISDLQAEIALESERFSDAVTDLKTSLALRKQLSPKESSLLAECHYKLSLALEFSSVTQQRDEEGNPQGEATVDQKARDEAASEMFEAIESCKLRVQMDELEMKALVGEEMAPQREKLELNIRDVQEMIGDMQLRLAELKKPPVSINDPKGTGSLDGSTPLNGILGQILGESKEEHRRRLDEASLTAKDLTGLVKKKKARPSPGEDGATPADPCTSELTATGNGKRKAAELEPERDDKEAESARKIMKGDGAADA